MKAAAVESLYNRRELACNKHIDEIRLNSDQKSADLLSNKACTLNNFRRHEMWWSVRLIDFQTLILSAAVNFNSTNTRY